MAAGLKLFNLDVITLVSGVAQALTSTTTTSYSIIVSADAANVGNVFMGDSTVSITKGLPIEPGNTLTISVTEPGRLSEIDAADIFAISSSTGNKVRTAVLRRRL